MDETTALGELTRGVEALGALDVSGAHPAEFVSLLTAVEVLRRRLDAVDVQLLAAADDQLIAESHCRSSLADLLVTKLRSAPSEARARVRRARDLGPRRTLTGELLEPIHPRLAAALSAGEISTLHVDVATRALGRVPCEAFDVAEQFLLEAARNENPKQLAASAAALLTRLDPDGSEPDDERNHDRRSLRLHRSHDGSWQLRGALTDETGLVWQTILDAVSAPAPSDDGERDPRSPEQRKHDGFRDLGVQVLRSGTLRDAGGEALTVVVNARPQDLASRDGVCQTNHGDVVRVATLRHLLGDAALVPLLFDPAQSGCELMLGRTRRLASRAQRRALKGRDGGCSFPGCERPASWCEVHHVIEWTADDGPTDIDNLTLLCGFHHREFGRRGWRVEMTGGLPYWVPPRWLDPDQTPRRNLVHHVPEIVFDPGGAIAAVHRP